VLRYSGIHGIGMVLGNAVTFVATIVIANFSEPDEFGQFGLLLFFASLLTLLFTLASKQGTLKRTFGGDDDEDDDDEDDDEIAGSPKRSLGTGLVTITIVSLIGTTLAIVFAEEISRYLLGDADPDLVVYAALAGATGAIYRVSSIAIWIERRPYSYVAVEIARPVFILAAVVPLLIAGEGIRGAIGGQAIGTALALLMSLLVLRGSWTPCWDFSEAIAIYRKGAIRVPLVLSMWVVTYADIFILSRFVDDADLGTYHLASRAAFLVAILPGGYRKALRPLQKTPMFRAVEDEYGVGNARGVQFGYFWFVLAGTMLMTTVMATVMVRAAPASYAAAAPLIPLVAGGLVAPTVYRMVNKSVKYADKRVPFIIGAVVAMLAFVALCVVLVPEIGVEGAPVAMMVAFAFPTAYVFARSQRGRSPIILPWRQMIVCTALAVAVALLHSAIDPGSLVLDLIAGLVAIALWGFLCLQLGAVPQTHRGALLAVLRGVRRRDHGFEAAAGLESLRPRERKSLRRAIVRGLPPEVAAQPALAMQRHANGDAGGNAHAVLVEILRRTAQEGGAQGVPADYARRDDQERDAQIGAYLFAQGPIAARDQMGKKLINDGVAEPFDLHTLEAVLASLRRAEKPAWRGR
jgi:O-antigen/teichoic acid export membrane protein